MALLPNAQQGQQLLNAIRALPGGVDMVAVEQGMARHGGIRFAWRRSGGLLATMIGLEPADSPVTVRRNCAVTVCVTAQLYRCLWAYLYGGMRSGVSACTLCNLSRCAGDFALSVDPAETPLRLAKIMPC